MPIDALPPSPPPSIVRSVARPGRTLAVAQPPLAAPPTPQGWEQFLKEARAVSPQDVLPAYTGVDGGEALAPNQSQPIKRAVLLVPARPEPGLAKAIEDMAAYMAKVTGQPVEKRVLSASGPAPLDNLPPGATVIVVGDGARRLGLVPAASGKPEGYAIEASNITRGGEPVTVIGLNGDDVMGRQRAVYRLMELSGQRFFNYMDPYTPPVGEARVPTPGFVERQAPNTSMTTRGFAPHLYHPIPLSIAFHDPSPAHLEMVKKYIDWSVQNGQNYIKLELLEQDAKNKYLPILGGTDNYDAWLPHARAILDYAHSRGVKLSVNVAFANFVSKNVYAINPVKATWQSFRLNRLQKPAREDQAKVKGLETQVAAKQAALRTAPAAARPQLTRELAGLTADLVKAKETAGKSSRAYQVLLEEYDRDGRQMIGGLVEKLMKAPWDEISWCLGSSEFSPTNDDLTIRWMNSAADYLKQHYPKTTTTSISHVPQHPHSEQYDDAFFNLVRYSDKGMGMMVHTTHAYAMTDPAPVYGNQNFEHKLKLMYESASPERSDVFYPESSYWVSHDASVPLFLPVYMLNRARDMEMVKRIPNMDGQVTFTTAWEWGYWLTDYAMSRLQSRPELNLTEVMAGAFAPFGEAKAPMVNLMRDVMLSQQTHLIDRGLIRHLQGFDALSDLGAQVTQLPVIKDVIEGSNNVPIRLKPQDLMKWDAAKLAAFDRGELTQIRQMAADFERQANQARALAPSIPAAAKRYHTELTDGLVINALRARQLEATFEAAVLARRGQLTRDPSLQLRAESRIADARRLTDSAIVVIRGREAEYRDAPAYTTDTAKGPTMWADRYLTRVHTAEYWRRTVDEAADAIKKK